MNIYVATGIAAALVAVGAFVGWRMRRRKAKAQDIYTLW